MTEQIDPPFQSQAAAATDLINLLSQKVVGLDQRRARPPSPNDRRSEDDQA